MSIDVNVQNDLVIVTESSEDITVNVSNAAGPAGVGVPSGGSTGQVLKKLSNTNYDTYWALDGGGVPYSGATGDVNLGEFQLRAGQLTLDTSPTGTAAVGTTRWNDTIGSSETTLKGGSVILKNGVDLVARVVNKVSPNTTLTKAAYQAVRVSGAQGQRLAVQLAQANNDANSADTIGLVTETIATNQEGFIITVGQLENINTTGSLQGETWADGDVLYLSPTTPGAITKVKPTGNGHIVVIGYVEYAHANNGKIYVKVMNGWELDELHDVSIVSPANNEALIYESSTALWKNKTIATALGYTPISGSGATGQVAYWNGTNSQTGSNNLFWDAANARLGIGTNAPAVGLDIRGSLEIARFGTTGSDNYINIKNSVGNFYLGRYANACYVWSTDTLPIDFYTNNIVRARIFGSSGNLVLQNGGTFTDGGQRLQVYGDAFIKGSGDTSATNALLIQNSLSNQLFRIPNNGGVVITAPTNTEDNNTLLNIVRPNAGKILTIRDRGSIEYGNNNFIYPTAGDVNATISRSTSGLFIGQTDGTTTTASIWNLSLGRPSNINNQPTIAVDGGLVQVIGQFNPTSGTAIFTSFRVVPTINQTGGANGITRGLYVNPTITAAADWRSIEWSNNSGWGLYGAGTANNFLGGDLYIIKNQNAQTSLLVENTTAGTNSQASITLRSDNGSIGLAKYSSTKSSYKIIASNDGHIYNGTSGDISFLNDFATGKIKMAAGASSTAQMTLTAAGRLLLGLTSESTFLLDVNGTARISDNLTISKNQNLGTSALVTNTTNGALAQASFSASTSSGSFNLSKTSASTTPYKIVSSNDGYIYNSPTSGDIAILNDNTTGTIKFSAGGSSTAQMTIKANGRINMSSLPTSSAGLSAGDLWNDGGTLKIV